MEPPAVVARELPFPRVEVDVGDASLSVVVAGPEDADRTVVALHGNPTWSFLWRGLIGEAVAAGHRVVVPDHLGMGLSDKPVEPERYTFESHLANMDRVGEALGLDGVVLVLHDWGGPIGMGWAARDRRRVASIVVTNTVAFAPRKRRALSPWHASLSSGVGQWMAVRHNVVQRSAMRLGVRKRLSREVYEAYAWPMRERGARVAAARFVAMVPDSPDHPTASTLRQMEEAYPMMEDVPMHVLWADRDPVFPPSLAHRWTRDFPHATVEHVSDSAGHFWQEDDPAPFVKRILDVVSRA